MQLFYSENISIPFFKLDEEESKHIVRVLRMKKGDDIFFTDGKGMLYHCRITLAHPKGCEIEILSSEEGKDKRPFLLHMAVAPTKNIHRYEWFLEKATEIGIDIITPFISTHSERKEVKTERLNRIITAAVKQSLKTHHPLLQKSISFDEFIQKPFDGQKFIAYIHPDVTTELFDIYRPGKNVLILIGPEGDFSKNEVDKAIKMGFVPVRLGPSRLRTETAAVVACHTIHLINYSQ